MTQLVHTSIPLLQPITHTLDLLQIHNLGLHPVNLRDASNLINRPAQQTQRKRLHNQMLNLIIPNLGLGRDRRERQIAVVRGTTEDHLSQRGEGDLLVQEDAVLLEHEVLGDVAGQDVVGG